MNKTGWEQHCLAVFNDCWNKVINDLAKDIKVEILNFNLTNDQIIEIGMEQVVQVIKFNVVDEIDKPHVILQLNVLGIIYGVMVPKHELTQQNIIDAWKQIITQFGVMHLKGQKHNIQDGSRDLTDEEYKILEEAKNGK